MRKMDDDAWDLSSRWFVSVLVTILGVVILRNAWVCDDAYITFRTVDNFVNGYGLTWNVAERVQSFSNPLWMLVVSVFYFFTREAFYTSIFLSLAASLAAASILAKRISLTPQSAGLAIVILVSSKAFIDYSTSGLENALSYLILALFVFVFLSRPPELRTFMALAIVASLGMVNRMDNILFFLPALVYSYSQVPWKQGLLYGLVGFSPFLIWEAFSLIYYGFPFPNTYYAKLHAGIPKSELLVQGLMYYLDTLSIDPLTLTVVGLAMMLAFASRAKPLMLLGGGISLYMIYIVAIGGDFMTGRFFAAPLFISVLIIGRLPIAWSRLGLWMSIGLVLILSLPTGRAPLLNQATYSNAGAFGIDPRGIADERAWYYQSTGLLQDSRHKRMPDHRWMARGDSARVENIQVKTSSMVGFDGYSSGPEVHLMDNHALADPLMARLPTWRYHDWRPGHYSRKTPPGYFETLRTGQNKIQDSSLALYYDHLQGVISGPIMSLRRFKDILLINIGSYDHLLTSYCPEDQIEVRYADVCMPKPPRTRWNAEGNHILGRNGIRISLDSVCHDTLVEISVDHNDLYYLAYILDGEELARQKIDREDCYGLKTDTLEVVPLAAYLGYDCLQLYPWTGDGLFSMGHVRLLRSESEKE